MPQAVGLGIQWFVSFKTTWSPEAKLFRVGKLTAVPQPNRVVQTFVRHLVVYLVVSLNRGTPI